MNILMVMLVMVGVSAPTAVNTMPTQETSMSFFSGIVLGVDVSKGLLSIEEASFDADKLTFTVSADTDIRKQSSPIGLGDIRVGDPVSVEYEETAKGPMARAVKVITKPGSN